MFIPSFNQPISLLGGLCSTEREGPSPFRQHRIVQPQGPPSRPTPQDHSPAGDPGCTGSIWPAFQPGRARWQPRAEGSARAGGGRGRVAARGTRALRGGLGRSGPPAFHTHTHPTPFQGVRLAGQTHPSPVRRPARAYQSEPRNGAASRPSRRAGSGRAKAQRGGRIQNPPRPSGWRGGAGSSPAGKSPRCKP